MTLEDLEKEREGLPTIQTSRENVLKAESGLEAVEDHIIEYQEGITTENISNYNLLDLKNAIRKNYKDAKEYAPLLDLSLIHISEPTRPH